MDAFTAIEGQFQTIASDFADGDVDGVAEMLRTVSDLSNTHPVGKL